MLYRPEDRQFLSQYIDFLITMWRASPGKRSFCNDLAHPRLAEVSTPSRGGLKPDQDFHPYALDFASL